MDTYIVKTVKGRGFNRFGEEVIDCITGCGRKTTMKGTKLCDGCWEARAFLRLEPEAQARLAATAPDWAAGWPPHVPPADGPLACWKEYCDAYAEAQTQAADIVWMSMQQYGHPDWNLRYVWRGGRRTGVRRE